MAYIKINKKNFFHNLSQFVNKAGSKNNIAIVLKDNAYGHGLKLMAQLSQEFGLTHAVVRTSKEAEEIKAYFKHILILGDRAIAKVPYTFTINCLEDIHHAEENSAVELKIDTGMHRNGIAPNEIEKAVELIKEKKLHLAGLMSHNRSADELSSELFWQHKNFLKAKDKIEELINTKLITYHTFNSATALRLPCHNEKFIRLGIGAYGYSELPSIYETLELKPVLSLWAKKVATRKLKKGERIGYGGQFIAPKDMIVSTYDLGYGDGWMRNNSFEPFITAERLPILGRVSMDYIVLESSAEEVCIFDNAQSASRQLKTISYEVMTQLHTHILRVVI